MDVRLPDGTILRGVPEGTTKQEIAQRLQAAGRPVPAEWMADAPPASVQAGNAIRSIPRAIGLTARDAVEGAGRLAGIVTEPVRQIVVNPVARLFGGRATQSAEGLGGRFADLIGLPAPMTPDERTVSEANKTMVGGAGLVGASRGLANVAGGVTQRVAGAMAANPGTQIAGAAGAGGAGGAVREAGGGEWEQLAAAVLGGVAAGSVTQAGARGAESLRRLMTPKTVQTRAADQTIQMVLERAGIDWNAVPENIRRGFRQEIADAMSTGGKLNADAVRRLAAYRITGTTPTVGQLTQNPSVITREQNLSRMGANSADPELQRLPQLTNANTARLLENLDDMGASAAPDAFDAGRAAMTALQGREASARSVIDALYSQARDTSGRSASLNPGAFTQRANQLLDEAMVGGALPPGVAATMNRIARGEMPFTVEIAEQFKTQIGKLQRASNDGQVRMALGLVRQAMDEAPLANAPTVNPGNLPAVPGTVPPSPSVLGEASIKAFNEARAANRAWMQRVEANPALKAVVDGIEPDQFVSKFIVGKGATVRDVAALRKELTPQAVGVMRQFLVKHLRDAATNNTDDITKFSQASYNKALSDLGERKLSLFFSREEINRLKAVGQAAKYMQSQPAGSAVNNSNSGALVLGRGFDMLERLAGYVPLGGRDIIRGAIQGQQQTQLLRPENALVQLMQREPVRVNPLLAATVPAPVQGREDDRRY